MTEEPVEHMESGADIPVEVDHMVVQEVIEHTPVVLAEHIQVEVENILVVLVEHIQVEAEHIQVEAEHIPVVLVDTQVEVENKQVEEQEEVGQHKQAENSRQELDSLQASSILLLLRQFTQVG